MLITGVGNEFVDEDEETQNSQDLLNNLTIYRVFINSKPSIYHNLSKRSL